jgi:hypothetical protein
MYPSSLPTFPDRPRPTVPLVSNGAEVLSSRRLTALGMRAVFLVGLWGTLFAFRSVLLSKEAELPNALLGTWEATDDSGFALEFTNDQQVRFIWQGKLLYSGPFELLLDNTVEIPLLVDQSGKALPRMAEPLMRPGSDLSFKVAIVGDNLSLNQVHCTVWPLAPDAFSFPPDNGKTLNFKRKR